MGTGVSPPLWPPEHLSFKKSESKYWIVNDVVRRGLQSEHEHQNKKIPSPRPISTGRLNTSRCVHLRPINLVVYQGPYPVNPVGNLISK